MTTNWEKIRLTKDKCLYVDDMLAGVVRLKKEVQNNKTKKFTRNWELCNMTGKKILDIENFELFRKEYKTYNWKEILK